MLSPRRVVVFKVWQELPSCRNLRMMITILHISEQRKGKGAPCGSTANGLLFLAVFYLGGPIQFGSSYREMSYSILHQHPMDRGQMREQFRGGCQSCLRLKILNMWIISMSTISQWATRGYSKFPILFPSYPSTFHIVEAKQLAKVSYLWHAATIHDAYALNSSKLVLNVNTTTEHFSFATL